MRRRYERMSDNSLYFIECLLLMFGITFTFIFLHRWYTNIYRIFNPKISPVSKLVLFLIPFLCFFIIFFAIVLHASFDVVTNQFYIALYTVLGFAWIHFGVKMLFFLFDLSVVDDVLHSGNKAALFPAAGGIAGLTLIYAGANIGDGPGFWCVFFAGGLGIILWILLILLINLITRIWDRILIARDIGSGIRFGGYLVASGLILARASGGDWFGFFPTITDFADGWVILPLTIVYILIELYYRYKLEKVDLNPRKLSSILWSVLLIAMAIIALIFIVPPFRENPYYG